MIRLSAALIGLVVVTLVIVWADPAEIGRRIASIPPAYVIVGLVIVQAQIVLSALRWRFTAT
ncbi:lysylphosphatidylglycerol synthase domain-containing protein [Rhizobium halophilum]|uniref:lysylphosphatidylglycerol synthase domain-containing protein n=1 Tax=Rhizobium halophilum TaxID=2846852 RepID=UPI001EFE932B|nr:lysylphosphatidylglycerol synthase domain-containing protein [Rhizobium halophilum]MCF6368020.1 hypothetical protein [Rhizobium halophilum]